MLGRALSRQIPRQIPGVGAVAPRQIPFVAATATRAFASNREAFDTKDRMVIPAVVKTKSGNMVRSPSAENAERKRVQLQEPQTGQQTFCDLSI